MDWPSLLPAPSIKLNLSHDPYVISSKMDSGKSRQRPRFTTETQSFNVSVTLNMFQMRIFSSFVKYKINRGADKFKLDLPSFNTGLVEKTEGFIPNGLYQSPSIAGKDLWKVSFTFVVEGPLMLSESELDVYLLYGENTALFIQDSDDLRAVAIPYDWQYQ